MLWQVPPADLSSSPSKLILEGEGGVTADSSMGGTGLEYQDGGVPPHTWSMGSWLLWGVSACLHLLSL